MKKNLFLIVAAFFLASCASNDSVKPMKAKQINGSETYAARLESRQINLNRISPPKKINSDENCVKLVYNNPSDLKETNSLVKTNLAPVASAPIVSANKSRVESLIESFIVFQLLIIVLILILKFDDIESSIRKFFVKK